MENVILPVTIGGTLAYMGQGVPYSTSCVEHCECPPLVEVHLYGILPISEMALVPLVPMAHPKSTHRIWLAAVVFYQCELVEDLRIALILASMIFASHVWWQFC